jgi:N-acetyl-anhydromuramyl-L-alanine amidase AmpD
VKAVAAQIRPNRLEVTDRFPMLGFTIRTDAPRQRVEVAIATSKELFRFDNKAARTTGTFYSSRAAGPIIVARGDLVWIVPPEVMLRFIGQQKLWVALASTSDGNGTMQVDVLPTEGSPYISIGGLTGRGMGRVRMLPTRQQIAAGYGTDSKAALEWAGDTATPGAVPVGNGTRTASAGGNGGAKKAANGNGQTGAAAPADYDDGFGPMPAPGAQAPASTAPANGANGANGTTRTNGIGQNGAASGADAPPSGSTPVAVASALQRGRARALNEDGSDLESEALLRYFATAQGVLARPLIISRSDTQIAQQIAPAFRDLLTFTVPAPVEQSLSARGMRVQRYEDAIGDLNLDFYPVRVSQLPSGFSTPEALLDHVRLNLNAFIDTDNSDFSPYAPGTDDVTWASSAPLGAAYYIDIAGPDDAAVVGSLVESHRWRFTTIWTPRSGEHPVTGHREWGCFTDGETGEHVFYTRGADRSTGPMETIGDFITFRGGDRLWLSLQRGLAGYINANGGSARAVSRLSCRVNWNVIRVMVLSQGLDMRATALDAEIAASDAVVDEDSLHGIDEPIPDEDTNPAVAAAALIYGRALDETPDYPQASRFAPAASTNYRHVSGTRTINRVVIHITDGGRRITGTIGWFQNPDQRNPRGKHITVSSHYVIGQDGEVVQMVRHNDVAWHGGHANGDSIGIEHVANTRGLNPTEPQYAASAALVAWLCATYGIPIDREHVRGHKEADPRTTHDCPSRIWDWDHYMDLVRAAAAPAPADAGTTDASTGQALAYAYRSSRALNNESFTINWDEVDVTPQPTNSSCWAAAAAMIVGWRDLISLTPETVTEICGRTTATGLDPRQVQQFADELGLVAEPPQSYAIEGFRRLLENNGPLWVGAAVPTMHVIVVTGMYVDGDNAYVRITDPWDREVGRPGAPGPRLTTHATGSRYIMRWEDFTREYEAAADRPGVGLQILHAHPDEMQRPGRIPANYGRPAGSTGYAQALRAARAMSQSRTNRPYARAYSDEATAPAPVAPPEAGMPLPAPSPAPVAPVPAAPTRRRETGSAGSVRWMLDQYDGLRRPVQSATSGGPGTSTTQTNGSSRATDRVVSLHDWPLVRLPEGDVQLPLTVSWRYLTGAVGDVAIRAGEPRVVPGWTLTATADISEGPDTLATAGLSVVVRQVFSHNGQRDIVALTQLTLFGDGTYQRQDRWEHAEAGAA